MKNHLGQCIDTSRVVDSRKNTTGQVYRRRVCELCSRKFTTQEVEVTELDRLRGLEKHMADMRELAVFLYDKYGPVDAVSNIRLPVIDQRNRRAA